MPRITRVGVEDMKAEHKENAEVRLLRTGAGYRVDVLKIGADERRTVARLGGYVAAAKAARRIAAQLRASDEFGTVRLMLEELF